MLNVVNIRDFVIMIKLNHIAKHLIVAWNIVCAVATSNTNTPAETTKFNSNKYFLTILFIPFLTHLSALHCTHFPFVWSSWVHMMLRCQASSRAAAEPNRREWGRKEERKWQTRAWGILGATKNSTERRRGEWWRVCRHNDEGNIGWVIFSCFKNEMFCSRNRKKKRRSFYSWVHVPSVKSNNGYFRKCCLLQK